jgi:ribonuclease P protein component
MTRLTALLQRRSPKESMTERRQDEGEAAGRWPQPRLKRRSEFLAAAKGKHFQSRCFSLQAARRQLGEPGEDEASPRFGITVTKKIGSAVVRNRIRRRLKEALRLAPDLPVRPGYDYVIVARIGALSEVFCALQDELRRALAGIHQPGRSGQGNGQSRSSNRAATPQDHPIAAADK